MSLLNQMRAFTRVAELSSFSQAALDLGLPKATVSTAVQQLENALGTRLLHRTTRRVALTQDGLAFYERSKDTLADIDELQTMFHRPNAGSALKGRVRIDMSTVFAHDAVLPRLPELLHVHPQLEIELSSTERRVDLISEGFDCVVRAGTVTDPGLVSRPLPPMPMVNCASPAYLARHGTPRTLNDLTHHQLVHYAATLGAKCSGFEYLLPDDDTDRAFAMGGPLTVNSAEAYHCACLAGLGLIQSPRPGLREALSHGRLVEVLPDYCARPMPLALVYANRRNQPARVRVVMDWLTVVVSEYVNRY
ncbi:MAG: LysR family transcriptional regulator [Rhodoferax sp.]